MNTFILDVCAWVHMSEWAWMYTGQRFLLGISLVFSPLLFETRSLTEPDTQALAYNGWPVRPRICLGPSPRARTTNMCCHAQYLHRY